MNRLLQQFLLAALLIVGVAAVHAADSLNWNTRSNRVDADMKGIDLKTLLEKIASTTGWEIFVEPDTTHEASTKFSNLPMEEALPRLLGKLNYALLPQTNAPSRFYVFRTTVGEATQRVTTRKRSSSDSHLIGNQLIVSLDPHSRTTIEELAKKLGAKIIGRSDDLHTYLLEFANKDAADAARKKLETDPDVTSLDSNYTFDPPETPVPVSASSTPPFKLRPTAVGDPNNIIVGLIDSAVSGIDPAMLGFLLQQLSIAGEFHPQSLTHGTSMAETLLQALANSQRNGDMSTVKILPVDVYGSRLQTTSYDIALGIYAAVNQGAMIINLSLGSSGDSQFLHGMIIDAHTQGVVFLAAAGNTPTTSPTYPAAYPEVIAVTAGNANRELASYANRGDFVDVIGPGGALVPYNGQFFFVTGTSVANAYQSGNAAAIAELMKKDYSKVESTLRNNFPFTPPPASH